jgi:hypothetical protein
MMRTLFLVIAVWQTAVASPALTADDIMARVAAKQQFSEHARAFYVYRQKIVVLIRDSQGHLTREEVSEFQVVPDAGRTSRELIAFSGRYWRAGTSTPCSRSGEFTPGDGFRYEADPHLSHNLRDGLIGNRNSKDGLAPGLFPLTASEQGKYRFSLKGQEIDRGVEVYRIAFRPQRKTLDEDAVWQGELLVSTSDFEPLSITTKLAHGIPLWVRTALGTNLPNLGFSVTYRKFDKDVWFPVSYGAEFRVRVLFVYSRLVSISMQNSDFRRTAVDSSVAFSETP